jgi:hypothetical protein
LTLKGYKQYWFKFQDTGISYFKSKEESVGEPIQQIHLKGKENMRTAPHRLITYSTLLPVIYMMKAASYLKGHCVGFTDCTNGCTYNEGRYGTFSGEQLY